MRMILLTISLIVVAAPSYAAQRQSLEQHCRALVGREEPEGTDGKSHIGQLNVQRLEWSLQIRRWAPAIIRRAPSELR
jgi:hypothetical protein